MLETIYFTRHGERSDWGESPSYLNGFTHDPKLSDHGRNQARELATYLASRNIKLDRLYSSPFYRTLETADAIAEKLNLQIFAENGLGEFLTPVDCERAPASLVQLVSYFPRLQSSYEPINVPSPYGETVQDFSQRVSLVMHNIISQCDEDNVKAIMLVGHAATVVAGVRAVMGDKHVSVNCGTCTLTVAKRNNIGQWQLIENGDASFLSKGEEYNIGTEF